MKTLLTLPLILLTLIVVKVLASSRVANFTCTAGHVSIGENAIITCHFAKNIFEGKTVYIGFYAHDAPEDDTGVEILCNVTKLLHGTCREKGRYVFRTNSKHELTVEILGITKQDAGRYMCQFVPPDDADTTGCRLEANEPEATPDTARESQPTQSARDDNLSESLSGDGAKYKVATAIVSVVLFIIFILAVVFVFYILYKRRKKRKTSNDMNKRHTDKDRSLPEADPLTGTTQVEMISREVEPPATQDSATPAPKRHTDKDRSLPEADPLTGTTQVEMISRKVEPRATQDSATPAPKRHTEEDRSLPEADPLTGTTQVEMISWSVEPRATQDSATPAPKRNDPYETTISGLSLVLQSELFTQSISSQQGAGAYGGTTEHASYKKNSQHYALDNISNLKKVTPYGQVGDNLTSIKRNPDDKTWMPSYQSVTELRRASFNLKENIVNNVGNPDKTSLLDFVKPLTDRIERL